MLSSGNISWVSFVIQKSIPRSMEWGWLLNGVNAKAEKHFPGELCFQKTIPPAMEWGWLSNTANVN